ncbi:hypothetical protein WJX72_010842 [[Myrmecia] bisecta]|uniref:Transmembrane protein 216 n=1 Tax=[Myrmecia] bisecta TaxID=41462 RepID=A0AAW1R8G6_9CHLO
MAVGQARARPVLTSLPLEILFYFGGWYDVLFWLLELAVFIYKGYALPYPSSNFAVEFTFIFLFLLIEPARLFLGSKGNKTERAGPLVFSMLLAAPLIAFFVYYLIRQTYVLKIEQFLNGAGLAFLGLQLVISMFTALSFWSASKVL